jgi:AcrR family transcriptional regulator
MEKADIRARFTRQALRDSLVELMKEKSILNISIKEICGGAGISRSTFYTYYRDQYDLLGQIEEEIFAECDKLIQKYSPSSTMLPARELVALMESILQYIAGNSNSIQVFLSENGESGFQRKFVRYFTGLMQQFNYVQGNSTGDGRIRKYHSVFIRDGCIAMIQEWLKNGMDLSVHDMATLFAKPVRAVLG